VLIISSSNAEKNVKIGQQKFNGIATRNNNGPVLGWIQSRFVRVCCSTY